MRLRGTAMMSCARMGYIAGALWRLVPAGVRNTETPAGRGRTDGRWVHALGHGSKRAFHQLFKDGCVESCDITAT
ncbi:hypothetical protein EDC01DRAFT_648094 [Geopyxis carbonaria]|nr:hypothetical protein EDC01DRAFT_648094 [Geopyxis carbonaria]